jgi:hypothetical protein
MNPLPNTVLGFLFLIKFCQIIIKFVYLQTVKELGKDGTYGDNHVLAAFSNEFEVSSFSFSKCVK